MVLLYQHKKSLAVSSNIKPTNRDLIEYNTEKIKIIQIHYINDVI